MIVPVAQGHLPAPFWPRLIRSGSDCAGDEAVPSALSVDRHARACVDVAIDVAAGDAGASIDVAADGAADHAAAGVDVPAHCPACDALPGVHVASNHAAMNVAGDLEIVQHPLDDVNFNPALHAILLPHVVDQDFTALGDADTAAGERAAVDGDPRHKRRLQEQSGQFVTCRDGWAGVAKPCEFTAMRFSTPSLLKFVSRRQRDAHGERAATVTSYDRLRKGRDQFSKDHRRILAACRAKDIETVVGALRSHLEAAARSLDAELKAAE
jgi:hypothetical protein